ncbi:MAG: ABC transporter permease subunit [Candidatus Latescibacteria bacterium]|nr:ABC transporter permease subunit [Candidatus Latescibacterota bacterium]NIM22221.1 ABC transporter permease subunit [Candidatus Latescibacterota bacterium]NIM66260.1 ABC transporter permease subunit [Candidatus Latescibacterota bacterium]NIO57480.1 ABC transporter permease subunit [Candidatus Latescibacterota bacterium]NIO78425.1 ABC transporter permease subunit [Candidatus Latescibacterota bacterium]
MEPTRIIQTKRRGLPPPLMFLLPWAVVYAAFFVFPFVFSFLLSFLSYNPLSTQETSWTGISNFSRLFEDPDFQQALRNTLLFVIVTVPLTTAAALGLALLLRERVPGRDLFKAGFFLPSILSMVVISLLFKLFYAPTGALNGALTTIGLGGHPWLTDPRTALPAIMLMDVWAAVGYYAVIFFAAFTSIPDELYEAASLEGSGTWSTFRYVTFPMLKPVIGFVVVINTIRSFQIFIEVFVMTQGGPLGSTNTLVLYLYETAFRKLDYGYASVIAYVVFLLSGVFSIFAIRRLKPSYTAAKKAV